MTELSYVAQKTIECFKDAGLDQNYLGLVSRRSYTPWRVGDRVLAISMVSPVLVSSLTSAERSLAFGD